MFIFHGIIKLETFMKRLLYLLFFLSSFSTRGQKLYFLADNFSAEYKYAESVNKLAKELAAAFNHADKTVYYDNLFRFQFAAGDYESALESMDSFHLYSKNAKTHGKSHGFPFRVYSMTMRSLQKQPSGAFEKEYVSIFNSVYSDLPDAGKTHVNEIFKKASIEKEKDVFSANAKQYFFSGTDSIDFETAIDLVKQWNEWYVYKYTAYLGLKQLAAAELKGSPGNNQIIRDTVLPETISKTYIQNVTLVDVEKQKLVTVAGIEISGGKISAIFRKPVNPMPANTRVIDGTGKYLLPGMTDAHIHFFQSGGLYTRPDAIDLRKHMPYAKEIEWTHTNMDDVLRRYMQNGITSVIDVGATNNFLQLRDSFINKSYAPVIFMTGPLLTSYEPAAFKNLGNDEPFNLISNEAEGIKMVQEQLRYKPDFIKIWYIALGNDKEKSARNFYPSVKAIIEEAHKHNLKVAVHATEQITARLAVEAGCDFLVHSVEDEVVSDDFLKLLKAKNVILCPTLVVHRGYNKTFGQELDFTTRELRMGNPKQIGTLTDLKHLPETSLFNAYKNAIKTQQAATLQEDSICLQNLKKMADAGIRIVAGTDAGNIGTLHGTSYLEELKAMKKSGMTTWQVLQSATINPSFIFGKEKETGSIALGKNADLVLLDANPVDNLENLSQIDLVFNNGYMIKPDTLIMETALALIQRQLNAYNDRDLEAFLEPYAEDVELYEFPSTLVSKGKNQMRKDYAFFNNVPNLHCEIKERIIQGNTIIDKESVTGFGNKPLEATAIYQVENNKIKRVYFISK